MTASQKKLSLSLSITDIPDSDLEQNLKISQIEIKENTKDIYIGSDSYNKKRFITRISLTYLFTHLFILISILIYYFQKNVLKKMFKNYCNLWNGYDIACISIITLCFFIPMIIPFFGRILRRILIILIFICFSYLFIFYLRIAIKIEYHLSEILICCYSLVFCNGICFFINCLIMTKKFSVKKGVIINSFFSAFVLFFQIYCLELFDPYLWKVFLYWFFSICYSIYLNLDIFFMLNKRNEYYLISDWFLGYAHLETDFCFRFWRDLFGFTPDIYSS